MQYIEVCEQGETPEERLERLEVTLEKKEAINKVIARILRIK
jgi:predicted RNase H-like HicB family nuclease